MNNCYEEYISKTVFPNNRLPNIVGWIDREGNHYPCERMHHNQIAQDLGYKNEEELENLGWVKIYTPRGSYYCTKRYSEQQYKWLIDNFLAKGF